jgi:DNA-binding MarR family transcriptional regulator
MMRENRLSPTAMAVGAMTRDIRKLFHVLAAVGDALHADLGITASMRAVLESLARGGAQTVPQMARARPVTRQHIQAIVDQLLDAGLVALQPNPAHKRSSLVTLTGAGEAAFVMMSDREAVVLDQIAASLHHAEVHMALRVLGQLREGFSAFMNAHSRDLENAHDASANT